MRGSEEPTYTCSISAKAREGRQTKGGDNKGAESGVPVWCPKAASAASGVDLDRHSASFAPSHSLFSSCYYILCRDLELPFSLATLHNPERSPIRTQVWVGSGQTRHRGRRPPLRLILNPSQALHHPYVILQSFWSQGSSSILTLFTSLDVRCTMRPRYLPRSSQLEIRPPRQQHPALSSQQTIRYDRPLHHFQAHLQLRKLDRPLPSPSSTP